MNDELRKLRFKEIGPFKDAMLAIQERVARNQVPRRNEASELEVRLRTLSLAETDASLAELSSEYLKACSAAATLYDECSRSMNEAEVGERGGWDPEWHTHGGVRSMFKEKGGFRLLEDADRLYRALSVRLDSLLQ